MIKRIRKWLGLNDIYAFSPGEVYTSLMLAKDGDIVFVPLGTVIDGKNIPSNVRIEVFEF